ncbi:hypothetical protein [Rubrivirga sp.]|uniref:hypothetical protein n=1 Tax=Rubrivirga sp. TaxID=1885344 RepID=UPI003C709964
MSTTQRVCPSCKGLTPSSRTSCAHCGRRFRNEMAWKIPLIVLLFVLAIAASVLIELEPW